MSGDKLNAAPWKHAVAVCPLTLTAGSLLNNNFINTPGGSSNIKGIVHPNFTHILLTTMSVEALVAFSNQPNHAGVPQRKRIPPNAIQCKHSGHVYKRIEIRSMETCIQTSLHSAYVTATKRSEDAAVLKWRRRHHVFSQNIRRSLSARSRVRGCSHLVSRISLACKIIYHTHETTQMWLQLGGA